MHGSFKKNTSRLIHMHLSQVATLCALALALGGCSPLGPARMSATEMPNPASVNCINMGGKLTLQRTPQGEWGMCQLPSGKVCEEWALFRGVCS